MFMGSPSLAAIQFFSTRNIPVKDTAAMQANRLLVNGRNGFFSQSRSVSDSGLFNLSLVHGHQIGQAANG